MSSGHLFGVLVVIGEIKRLGVGVGDGASGLPHPILLGTVISPILLAGLLVVIAAGGVVSITSNELVPGGRHGRERGCG